ncbi:hypothetical protein [uncultured Pseudoalteromonas sp.]|uniref:hypothetical protein n=1 Tax=uncultured Pseudoalteromonas sp. TaxID=114053 RepID=UPI0030C7FDF6
MKRATIIIIALGLTAVVIYKLAFNNKDIEPKTAPIAVDIVPVDSKFAANKKAPQPINMSKDPVNVKPQTIDLPEQSGEFEAINKVSAKAKEVLSNAKVLPSDLNNEAYIEFDLNALYALKTGESFDISIPQTAETYSAEITSLSEASNGDKSIFGQVIGANGQLHTTVMTVGKDAVYGQFTAPSGNYVFESKGKYGWIAAKRDLYKSHIEHHVDAPSPKTDNTLDIFAPKNTEQPNTQ